MDVLRSAPGGGTRRCEAGEDLSEALKEEEEEVGGPSRPDRKEPSGAVSLAAALGDIMQHPLEMGAAHYYAPPDALQADQHSRSHRYRSFMIEEILTDHPERKEASAAPAAGEQLLKFGVQALLSARPFHSHLGRSVLYWTTDTPCRPV